MSNVFYQKSNILKEQRAGMLGQSGAVVWFTGLSGSGKSTVACLSEKMLLEDGRYSFILDGDNLRLGLNSDLGFSDGDRRENIRRAAHVAALFAQSGAVALVSLISPFAADRSAARSICESAGCPFVEVFVDTPLDECVRRDVKGLYKRAMSGEIKDFTGISSPYEPPEDPELVIKTTKCNEEEAAQSIIAYLDLLRSLRKMTEFAAQLSVEAGKEIMEIYNKGFTVDYKADSSPLTDADTASNALICAALKAEYPRYAILSEESKDGGERLQNNGCFIVDPLDGTKEFIKRNGEFTVNIAFSYLGKSVMGVVYAPVLSRLYYAAKGLGAYARNITESGCEKLFNENERIHVSDKRSDLTVMASRSHADEKLTALLAKNSAKIGGTKSSGSSLKGCMIAEGEADVYYRTGFTMEWDTAAMQCVVEEAGGVFRQGNGTPMRYNRKNSLNDKGFFILNSFDNRFEE